MFKNELTIVDTLLPFDELYPFFAQHNCYCNNNRVIDKEQFVKIYNDGGHYVAKPIFEDNLKYYQYKQNYKRKKTELDNFFESAFLLGLRNNLKGTVLSNFLIDSIVDKFNFDLEYVKEYVAVNFKRKLHNLHKRFKLFKRKANLNKWNTFVTITYDDKKHTAETFRQKLRKTLANFHTRRGWKYMGVFEYAPETKRLHFHALMYIPENEMVGTIEKITDYSTAQHKMQTTYQNTFFLEKFGRNDFENITDADIKNGKALDYIIKYIAKTDERILYSRGIPSELIKKIDYKDVACLMFDFVQKFILFDDVIDYERDVLKIPPRKKILSQISMFDVC